VEDILKIDSSIHQEGLAHTMAEAGLLPMYGMPTRTRNLYLKPMWRWDEKKIVWDTIDRDLEIAIHEFAPGSVLVKDKREHQCAGFTGPILARKYYKKPADIKPLDNAFGESFYLSHCECGASLRDESPEIAEETQCLACTRILPTNGVRCMVPNGFRTDFKAKLIDDQFSIRQPHRSITAEGTPVDFRETDTNLAIGYLNKARTYRLNKGRALDDNDFEGFHADSYSQRVLGDSAILHHQYIDSEHITPRDRGYLEPDEENERIEGVWLAAPKTTDSIFLMPDKIRSGLRLNPFYPVPSQAIRSAALSATYLLVDTASMEYLDVDPDEFDVLEPRVHQPISGQERPILQFTDTLINGAGFCRKLSDGSNPLII
jgi:hypothetical protein